MQKVSCHAHGLGISPQKEGQLQLGFLLFCCDSAQIDATGKLSSPVKTKSVTLLPAKTERLPLIFLLTKALAKQPRKHSFDSAFTATQSDTSYFGPCSGRDFCDPHWIDLRLLCVAHLQDKRYLFIQISYRQTKNDNYC